MMRHKFLLAVVAVLAVTSCTATPTIVGGGEIRNDTGSVVLQVRAEHHPTRRVVFANQILPGHSLSLGFNPRELQAKYADLTWRTADGQQCEARLHAPSCPPELANQPVWVVYSIHSDRTATVDLVPAR